MPTLTDALRRAALDRAHAAGEVVDEFILEPNGVIDLRRLEAESGTPRTVKSLPTIGITEAFDIPVEEPMTRTLWRRSASRKDTGSNE